ncbi:quinone oxidoreductase family protein [Azohydromonas lata]|uniref:Zinc-binding alcohol dehydrogenase family protein n=1 Tax=Azohydromonas lata TaxID=45677 RepID=A0ABU5IFX2_9BURK|nr:zinc-binding alcohol dehydrogenase family protein [Azohydromonas lata]MDZ5458026.1 zinc-binding alcohol dehydrogenase family protein [Azohydromonas lata]
MTFTNAGRKLVLTAKAADAQAISPQLLPAEFPVAPEGHAVVEVKAAAVNPSDVKAALGLMPHAVWPRTPGRDFAGVVVAGPGEWRGVEVWGTGGDLGMVRDGTHARYLVLPVQALSRKPASVSLAAAATVGVPFITAHEGLRRAGLRGRGQTLLVLGANGKVGQAAIQLATRAGARVLGVERDAGRYIGHASGDVQRFRANDPELAERIKTATQGRGVDIAYNTVGSPYFQLALETLAIGGTQVLISTIERSVPFDILAFYRRNLQMLGVDSLKLTASECATTLNSLLPGFDDGSLKAFEVDDATLLPLEQAAEAYRRVLSGSTERIVLAP